MSEIIDDTITRNREWKKTKQEKLNRLKRLNAPVELIQEAEKIANMDYFEYQKYIQQMEENDKIIKAEYAKNNPLKKEIVDKIYDKVNKLEYDFYTYTSNIHFLQKLDPLSFMSNEDYEHDLYLTFINHAHELYCQKYEEQQRNAELNNG